MPRVTVTSPRAKPPKIQGTAAPAVEGDLNGSLIPNNQQRTSRKRDRLLAFFTPQGSQSNSRNPSPTPAISRIPSPLPCAPDPRGRPALIGNAPYNPEGNAGESAVENHKADSSIASSTSNSHPQDCPLRSPPDSQFAGINQSPGVDIQQDQCSTLWNEAYHKLPVEYKSKLDNLDQLQVLQRLIETAAQAKERFSSQSWRIPWVGKEIDVREKAEKLMGWITKFRDIGDIAVQYDPVHAALPWAGVRFILTLVIGEQELLAAAVVGMERIAILIARCAVYEQLYFTDIQEIARSATTELRNALLGLYTTILQALSRLINIFQRNILQNLKSLVTVPEEIKELDGRESAVTATVMVVENCYNLYSRNQHKGEFEKLRNLLEDFFPVISQLQSTAKEISQPQSTAKEIYQDIKESERVAILKWLSTIPYQSHHDLACDGRVEGTGQWLFQRGEFIHWQQSVKSEILWLHGIPGAGKTNLVSATIEKLKGNLDKVAFFYCKRDEEDRQNRHKILLSLVKQLACPTNGTGIHIKVKDIYDKEQKDPSSRGAPAVDSALTLLASLLETYQAPVLVLDALDECSKESRGWILKDLLSLMKSNVGVKVFISSRHSLDIEDRLRNLPHVCIEARDNAQDIVNYVKMELSLRVEDGRLLRGRVSQDLLETIQKVLIRDANGMFLWVDYQIRDLCNIHFERDIIVRLGKLPKDLAAVYDEIMDSIQSQLGSTPQIAARALKWMLVATKPLEPLQLLTAIEIDPTLPLNRTSTSPFQPSPDTDIELIIQLCGGLILLDKPLGVLRFVHLSVQEYLEEKSKNWNVIDAHLHVAECSLWVLQDSYALTSIFVTPLYRYMALNWFRHCRSYQDLLQDSASSDMQLKHKLEIPLLNSFLGSFHHASASYTKWQDWIPREYSSEVWALRKAVVNSRPTVSPSFVAAFSGLGVLVDWLWRSEGVTGNIKNDEGNPLLYIAASYGSSWVVESILAHGDVLLDRVVYSAYNRHYGTALCAASYHGQLDVVTSLLNRGADPNIIASEYGTALGAAANRGRQDTVALLLDRGADPNVVGESCTALGAAAYAGRIRIVTLLLERGADLNIIGGIYGTALSAATYARRIRIVTLLLERGADPNLVGGHYGTALGAAAFRGRKDTVTLLLNRGADPNLVGGTYFGTALGAAAYAGGIRIVTLLLDRGADPNIITGDYGTALDCANLGENQDIVTLLQNRGATMLSSSESGKVSEIDED